MTTGSEHWARQQGGESAPRGGTVTVRYWAGARAAAGVESEPVAHADAPDIATLKALLASTRPALAPVLIVASLLLDGHAVDDTVALPVGACVEVLPPFAGG